jgi:NRPS condensation-like uncharacterized protein
MQAPHLQGVYDLTINDILLPNMKKWDKEKVETIFPLSVANRILKVPLFDEVDNDQLVLSNDNHRC